MHMLDSISKSKDNQAIKFSQLIEFTMRNHAENEALRLVLDLLYFWKISEVQQVTTTY